MMESENGPPADDRHLWYESDAWPHGSDPLPSSFLAADFLRGDMTDDAARILDASYTSAEVSETQKQEYCDMIDRALDFALTQGEAEHADTESENIDFSYSSLAGLDDDGMVPFSAGALLARPDCPATETIEVFNSGIHLLYRRLLNVEKLDPGNARIAEAVVEDVRRQHLAYRVAGVPQEVLRYGVAILPRPVPEGAESQNVDPIYKPLGDRVMVAPFVALTQAQVSKLTVASVLIANGELDMAAEAALNEMGYGGIADVAARIKAHNARGGQQLYLPSQLRD